MQQNPNQPPKFELKLVLDPVNIKEKQTTIHINRRVAPAVKANVEKAVEILGVKTPADLLIMLSEQVVKQYKKR